MNLKKFIYLISAFAIAYIGTKCFVGVEKNIAVKNSTSLIFDYLEYDFSVIKKDKEVFTYFVYKNTGKHPLKIKNINSSCGCTIPFWSKKVLNPNEVDSILVKYDSKSLGYFSKKIYVVSNSETSPDALYVRGTVVQD